MIESRIMMGMTIVIEIADKSFNPYIFQKVFIYFDYIDNKFSVFKDTSEITLINKKKIKESEYSEDMSKVFNAAEEIKKITNGYFDIKTPEGLINPSGIVKGWAIKNAAEILKQEGIKNFYVNAGGDIEVSGKNSDGEKWSVGIRNPFNPENEVIKVVYLENGGIATSGNYIRGQHIYNPHNKGKSLDEIVSVTVIGSDVYEADCYATAAFAMGRSGIDFLENLRGFEGYMIDNQGIATMTSGFDLYLKK